MSKKALISLVVPGHGGQGPMKTYLTRGKRSPQIPPGVYEGFFNEQVATMLEMHITANHRDCGYTGDNYVENLRPGALDVPLKSRIKYANRLAKKLPEYNFVYLALHANAKGRGKKWSDAQGHKVFYKKGCKKSKKLAEIINKNLSEAWPDMYSRGIKSVRWMRECRGPKMPSVLVEHAFMTNLEDCEYLSGMEHIEEAAKAHAKSLQEFELWLIG
jgi:N-acetylmuramoyl-L-alanine amidase